ncbi:MAG: hypothetical protein WC648_03010 [Candidatus Paceibacterota bacterium]|jgi:hypothetical protein
MRKLYKQLGWDFDELGLIVPERVKGFDRLIVMADTELTFDRAFDVCSHSFPCWRHRSCDKNRKHSTKDERHPKSGVYAIWVRDSIETDSDLRGLSADDIKRDGSIRTMTALERVVLEGIFFMETGGHLDRECVTYCTGSRYKDRGVPGARQDNEKFIIYWRDRSSKFPTLGPRRVIAV